MRLARRLCSALMLALLVPAAFAQTPPAQRADDLDVTMRVIVDPNAKVPDEIVHKIPLPKPGQPAGTIAAPGGAPSVTTCTDRIPPVSRVTSARVSRSRAVVLRGRSSDRGCGAKGAGRVSRVRVAVGRRYANQKCRYLRPDNRFGAKVSCLRTTYLSTRGTTSWSVRLRRRLPRGRYVVWVRGIDAAGNIERKARRVNLRRFTVR